MPRAMSSMFRSRFLWKVYWSTAMLLLIATSIMSLGFIYQMRDVSSFDPMRILRPLIIANGLGVAVALVAGWWLARSVHSALEEVTTVAQSLTCGDFEARVRLLRDDEFGLLGQTLNLLGEELTERMAALSQERAQLQAMLAGMVEGIVAIGDDDCILFCNSAADRLLHSDISGARGKSMSTVAGLGLILPLVLEARRSSVRVQRELHVGGVDDVTALETKAARFRGEQASGVVVVLHDVTDLRKLERVRRDFVANVSHELKTPLTSIKGYVETLQAGAKEDPVVLDRFLAKIESNVGRLVALVQDILSLARIENHDGSVTNTRVDWSILLRQVLTHHEHEVQRKNLALEVSAIPSALVFGDREAMTQVVDNLLSNAIKYTPEGGRIRLTLRDERDSSVLSVEDSGIGIPREHLPRIFERFYRVDKARSREVGGTGLGLSIVKHLVSAMRGEVQVHSEPGAGSTFSVRLQRAP